MSIPHHDPQEVRATLLLLRVINVTNIHLRSVTLLTLHLPKSLKVAQYRLPRLKIKQNCILEQLEVGHRHLLDPGYPRLNLRVLLVLDVRSQPLQILLKLPFVLKNQHKSSDAQSYPYFVILLLDVVQGGHHEAVAVVFEGLAPGPVTLLPFCILVDID